MALKLLVFLGSVRDSTPPRPARLGRSVARACTTHLAAAGHDAVLIDPLDFDLSGPFKPQFAYAQGKAPAALTTLAEKIAAADGYVMVSPEYNHLSLRSASMPRFQGRTQYLGLRILENGLTMCLCPSSVGIIYGGQANRR